MSQPLHTQFDSIPALAGAVNGREVSAIELARSALEAITSTTGNHLFTHVDADLTLQQAEQVDKAVEQGNAMPLAGVPVAFTNVIATAGWHTTASSKMLASYVSPFDATIVRYINAAGGLGMGKLNCDEFGMGSDHETSVHGSPSGPGIPAETRAAAATHAAVANGLLLGAITLPVDGNSRCGLAHWPVSSIRPTYGVASRFGLVPNNSSMDQPCVIARQVTDLAPLLDSIGAFDPADATSLTQCNRDSNAPGRILNALSHTRDELNAHPEAPLRGMRIGIPERFVNSTGEHAITEQLEQVLTRLESLGARRTAVQLDHLDLATPVYRALNAAEASSNLSRYDGVHFGYRASDYDDLTDMMAKSRQQAFGDEVKRRILLGTHLLTEANYDRYYVQAQRIRRLVTHSLSNALVRDCDLLLAPDACFNDITAGSMLAGLPALTLPGVATDPQDTPNAVQLVAPHFAEGLLLAVGEYYQQVTQTSAA
ncbi:MAG TPA: amidase family protein [Burkholderiaceae bacterium]|nr:amidase family protein [Burkholderiaceae bacterium]